MRKPLIAGNWKMNKTNTETEEFLNELLEMDLDSEVEALICPPTIDLYLTRSILKDSSIKLGAQNMHNENQGAFTGETSPIMLTNLGVDYVILGHSERRSLFGETDDFIATKLASAYSNDLLPILCVGESLEEREAGSFQAVVKSQVSKGINGIDKEGLENLVIAYEPVWAIGTGRTASIEDASNMAKYIRKLIHEMYGEISEKVRILYGGSVKPENIKEFMAEEDIDGALVGGASLDAKSFASLVNYRR